MDSAPFSHLLGNAHWFMAARKENGILIVVNFTL